VSGSAQYRALGAFIVTSGVFVAVFVALTLSAYHKPAPHDLPVGIVGPAAVARQVEHGLGRAAPALSASAATPPRPAPLAGSRSGRSMAR
jgi:hypothetical protein